MFAEAVDERSSDCVAGGWGPTPLWLIRRRRLHEAADRLRADTAPLAKVATDLGYADQAHFFRDFKQATGMTPGTFARMSSGG